MSSVLNVKKRDVSLEAGDKSRSKTLLVSTTETIDEVYNKLTARMAIDKAK